MSEYKLIYFDEPGRAEPIRLLFALSNTKYEDFRVKKADWPSLKKTTPWGQIPILEVDGQQIIAQTTTIARFLARRFGLAGTNEFEIAECEEIVDAANDFLFALMKYVYQPEPDQSKKEEELKNLIDHVIPKYFGKFNEILDKNGGNFLVGTAISWADVYIAYVHVTTERILGTQHLEPYPLVKKLKEVIYMCPGIKEYVEQQQRA